MDRIKEVAGVDTATIFFGDLRVSTNVDDAGNRAIGTRVSQEVFDTYLLVAKYSRDLPTLSTNGTLHATPALRPHWPGRRDALCGRQAGHLPTLARLLPREVYLIAAATILLAILIAIPLACRSPVLLPISHTQRARCPRETGPFERP